MIRLLITLLASLAAFAVPDLRSDDGAVDAFLGAELRNAEDQEMFALVGGPSAEEKQESVRRALSALATFEAGCEKSACANAEKTAASSDAKPEARARACVTVKAKTEACATTKAKATVACEEECEKPCCAADAKAARVASGDDAKVEMRALLEKAEKIQQQARALAARQTKTQADRARIEELRAKALAMRAEARALQDANRGLVARAQSRAAALRALGYASAQEEQRSDDDYVRTLEKRIRELERKLERYEGQKSDAKAKEPKQKQKPKSDKKQGSVTWVDGGDGKNEKLPSIRIVGEGERDVRVLEGPHGQLIISGDGEIRFDDGKGNVHFRGNTKSLPKLGKLLDGRKLSWGPSDDGRVFVVKTDDDGDQIVRVETQDLGKGGSGRIVVRVDGDEAAVIDLPEIHAVRDALKGLPHGSFDAKEWLKNLDPMVLHCDPEDCDEECRERCEEIREDMEDALEEVEHLDIGEHVRKALENAFEHDFDFEWKADGKDAPFRVHVDAQHEHEHEQDAEHEHEHEDAPRVLRVNPRERQTQTSDEMRDVLREMRAEMNALREALRELRQEIDGLDRRDRIR